MISAPVIIASLAFAGPAASFNVPNDKDILAKPLTLPAMYHFNGPSLITETSCVILIHLIHERRTTPSKLCIIKQEPK